MPYYIEILAVQEPFTIGTDPDNRVIFSMNFQCKSGGLVTGFEESIIKILTNAGLCTSGINAFMGPTVTIPGGSGPFLHLINTGGYAPEQTQEDYTMQNPSFQILVYAEGYVIARDKAVAVWRELHGKRNITVTV